MDRVLEKLLEKVGEGGRKEWERINKEKNEVEYNYYFYDRRMVQVLGELHVELSRESFSQLVNMLCDAYNVERCEVYFMNDEVGDNGQLATCGSVMKVYGKGVAVYVLCHELAHWLAGPGLGHGDRWRECYMSLVHTLRHNFKADNGVLY